MDPIAQFKENQKKAWSGFAPLEMATSTAAPALLRHARVTRGARLLDVGCGTGVVALTAARDTGAIVTGLDLTPELLERARQNAALMKLEVDWHLGDAEALPFPDSSFAFVVSQFGHMFAPRPEVALREMLRVLEPGGTIAFSTWPPELLTGKVFALGAKYGPPPPEGVSSPVQWGDPGVIRERLGQRVKDVAFTRDTLWAHALSVPHFRVFMEAHLGPLHRLVAALEASDPPRLAALRAELEDLTSVYFDGNRVRQDFLVTRAVKVT